MRAYLLIVMTVIAPLPAAELTGIILTTDRTVDCTSNASIIRDTLADTMNPQQKAYTLWRFFIQRNMHREEAQLTDHGNAAELMTKTAYALCGSWGHHYAGLAADAGLTASNVYLNGHVVAAVEYWGGWHMYDADMWCLYPRQDGVVASPYEIRDAEDRRDKWVYRTGPPVKSYPWYIGPDTLEGVAAMYAKAQVNAPYKPHEWRWKYDLRLRPGTEIIWSWYPDPDVGFASLSHVPDVRNPRGHKTLREYLAGTFDYYTQADGKPAWSWGGLRGGLAPNPLPAWNGVDGNGRLVFDLGRERSRRPLDMCAAHTNLTVTDGEIGLTDPAQPGSFILDFSLPYQYGDAWIAKPLPEQGLTVSFSRDRQDYTEVYPSGGIDDGHRIRLFDQVRGLDTFRLKVELAPDAGPLTAFRAVGVFHHAFTALPALLKGRNKISVKVNDPQALVKQPLHATYVYDQAAANREVYRHQMTFTFTPQALTWEADTGKEHWPLMRSIRMVCGGPAPRDPDPVVAKETLDWGAYPWDWAYNGVNFWNDFERGDRQGWRGTLTTDVTSGNSDFALDNSIMNSDGTRQFKLIKAASFLNRDSVFRCELMVKGIASVRFYTRDQGDKTYYEQTFTGLKENSWQTLTVPISGLHDPKAPERHPQGGEFMSQIYLAAVPAPGIDPEDTVFIIDNVIGYDGELRFDPFTDPDAPLKALTMDPIWNARPGTK